MHSLKMRKIIQIVTEPLHADTEMSQVICIIAITA